MFIGRFSGIFIVSFGIDYFCKDDKVVSRNTFLSSGKTKRSHKHIIEFQHEVRKYDSNQ